MRRLIFCAFLGGLFFLTACNESITVGSELVIDEDVDLAFTDTLTIKAKSILRGPVPTYFNTNFLNSTFLLGELEDPIFGTAKSSIYFDMQLGGFPNFGGGTLDSMYMVFNYNRNGFYGDSLAAHQIEVWQLSERLDQTDTLYSNQSFSRLGGTLQIPIASIENFVPNRVDSITYTSYTTEAPITVSPRIRMKVNDRFAQMLFNDSIANATDQNLLDLVNGFVITSTPTGGNSMIGLDMAEFSQITGLEVYFVNELGAKTVYRYQFRERRHQNFELNSKNSTAQNFIGQNITNGDPLFVQGMSGIVTEFDLSSVQNLNTKLLNLAELEVFYYDNFEGDDEDLFPPANALSVVEAETGREIVDLQLGRLNRFIDILFGGELLDSRIPGVKSYKMNITSHLKRVQNENESPIVHLEIRDKTESPRRTIIYGPGHPTLAPKLKISFTIP